MGKKRKASKPAEDKHEKFVRVVTPRVKKALKAIGLIGNQSGSAYEYTQDEVHKIFGTLHETVSAVEKRYQAKGKQEIDFSLEQEE